MASEASTIAKEEGKALKDSTWHSVVVKLGYYLYKKELAGDDTGKDEEVDKAWEDFTGEMKRLTGVEVSEEGIIEFLAHGQLPAEWKAPMSAVVSSFKEKNAKLFSLARDLAKSILSVLQAKFKKAGYDVPPAALATIGVIITAGITFGVMFLVWSWKKNPDSNAESLSEDAAFQWDPVKSAGSYAKQSVKKVMSTATRDKEIAVGLLLIVYSIVLYHAYRKKSDKNVKFLIGYLAYVGVVVIVTSLSNRGVLDGILASMDQLGKRIVGSVGAGASHWNQN